MALKIGIYLTDDPARQPPEMSVVPSGTESATRPARRGQSRSITCRESVSADPVVHDNLGQRIPIGRTELDVIESYLERELRELLGPVTWADNREGI